MNRIKKSFVLIGLTLIFLTTIQEVWAMEKNALSPRQQSIIAIAAFTANGELEKLEAALHEGLKNTVTVNEIKEVLVQAYAYAGFPRSLNGINTFMAVMEKRKASGITDEQGPEASPPPTNWNRDEYGANVRAKLAGMDSIPAPAGYQLFTPVIDTFLKEHLFADIFVRDTLDHQSRELATISMLAAMPGLEGQLRFHINAAMNMGLDKKQVQGFITVLAERLGRKEADAANAVLEQVLADRANKKRGLP